MCAANDSQKINIMIIINHCIYIYLYDWLYEKPFYLVLVERN